MLRAWIICVLIIVQAKVFQIPYKTYCADYAGTYYLFMYINNIKIELETKTKVRSIIIRKNDDVWLNSRHSLTRNNE